MKQFFARSNFRLAIEVLLILVLVFLAWPQSLMPAAASPQAPEAPEALNWYVCNPPNHVAIFMDRVHIYCQTTSVVLGGTPTLSTNIVWFAVPTAPDLAAASRLYEFAADGGHHRQAGLDTAGSQRYFRKQFWLRGCKLPAHLWHGNAMSGKTLKPVQPRLILDCCLLISLVLLAIANHLPAQAKIESFPSFPESLMVDPVNNGTHRPERANPLPALYLLDNNTLAAMIAAENASLTLPIYLIDLPLVAR